MGPNGKFIGERLSLNWNQSVAWGSLQMQFCRELLNESITIRHRRGKSITNPPSFQCSATSYMFGQSELTHAFSEGGMCQQSATDMLHVVACVLSNGVLCTAAITTVALSLAARNRCCCYDTICEHNQFALGAHTRETHASHSKVKFSNEDNMTSV